MAFGFGFNKQKALSAAEKYVQQGKLQNAIAEYEKILKNDAKELTVNNTVGDLYARLGDLDKATHCFKAVGDAYATQGFTVKAIAMFKKISKLKPSLENVLKLAELYTQQGLFNDARAQYLQVADQFLKASEFENAVRIFQKILEMDPENVAMRVRLAEVYVRMGKKPEAWQIFSAAAESMRSRGSLTGAEEVLQRMLTLDPTNSYALLMQGKNLMESGDAEGAIKCLQKIGDLDSNPDGLRDLLKAYLQTGMLSDAGTIANKLLNVHNDLSAISSFADALMQAGQYENALQVYDQHAERLLAENSERVLENLHSVIGHVRENPASLEKLLALFQKAGETTHVTEVCELLAHASVQSGDLARARDLYHRLATLEPQNSLHMKSYQQVVSQLGGSPANTKLISAEEAAVIVDELEATSPAVHQHYPDDVAIAVRSALTDAELFISYNMPAKAFEPLLAARALAPQDLRLNQRLAALHTRASRFAEASVCCRSLQNVYSEAGYPEDASRYGELADRYEERSSARIAPDETTPEFSVDEVASDTFSVEDAAVVRSTGGWPASKPDTSSDSADAIPEFSINEFSVADETATTEPAVAKAPEEIDLSDWEDTITVEEDAPADVEIADTVGDHELPGAAAIEVIDEMRFYLSHGMPDQARAALPRLQSLTQDAALIARINEEIEEAIQAAAKSKEPAVSEKAQAMETAEAAHVQEFDIEELSPEDIPSIEVADETVPVSELSASISQSSAKAEEAPVVGLSQEIASVADVPVIEPAVEAAADQVTLTQELSEPVRSAHEPATPEGAHGLQDFVADLQSALGNTPSLAETPAELQSTQGIEIPVATEEVITSAATPLAPETQATAEVAQPAALGDFVADLETSLGDNFLKAVPPPTEELPAPPSLSASMPLTAEQIAASQPPAAVPAPVTAPLAVGAAASASATHSTSTPQNLNLAPVAPQLPTPPPVAIPTLNGPAASKSSPFSEDTGVDLNVMFGELKQDLESGIASNDEDPETHYNLGVAFREMGLLDEAIGELQKACQSVDHGRPFSQTMQAYTWLAQCFLEKGVPEAAVRWYDRALAVPGIDGETRVALHYELGSAFESAGDKPSALKHFTNVYGSNIDYRDVAERIKALKS
ncbi:MAG TPA: tetratricopeptide repeat protein [Candidatus Sulfotelmatobacter sp.]